MAPGEGGAGGATRGGWGGGRHRLSGNVAHCVPAGGDGPQRSRRRGERDAAGTLQTQSSQQLPGQTFLSCEDFEEGGVNNTARLVET